MLHLGNAGIGFKAVRHLGIVRGITVRSRSAVGNFVGGIQSMFGGQIGAYVELAEASRQEAWLTAPRFGLSPSLGELAKPLGQNNSDVGTYCHAMMNDDTSCHQKFTDKDLLVQKGADGMPEDFLGLFRNETDIVTLQPGQVLLRRVTPDTTCMS